MSTFRRRLLVTAALPAAALGFLLAAPGAASASTTPAPTVAQSSDDGHGHHHHHHGLGLNLSLVLGLHISGHGGWHDSDCDGGLLGDGLVLGG
ncbi:hypothetical protein M8542_49480 [Amycolatopsis sp. OK19-0408]|uniref:Secreted protein n=1 Tax=Amycolatopsis iheyensis TaxID=2945988 RepID=A0A9X2SRN5_9PSEU|nr:hypothetical protein [Amycolatopsis iheyensis]MCR6490841.1 hypothetical protein [Amycolatopsis iheyensis]